MKRQNLLGYRRLFISKLEFASILLYSEFPEDYLMDTVMPFLNSIFKHIIIPLLKFFNIRNCFL